MKTKTASRFFAPSEAGIVHQNGSEIGPSTPGVEVILHTRNGETDPCCAEVIGDHIYAEIGLFFEHGKLCDCDGVFFLPREVGVMLTQAGYAVPDEFFA
ncbi:MAG TPA: hypothetical protein VH370_05420 [Humisphaera sp.]|nr:hypothetical protein [Humisphaera sp.]